MKNVLLLFFLAITLSSCEKEEGLFHESNLVTSIETEGQGGEIREKILIKYDDLDRVYSINDTVFYYGPNDKVSYSRYSESLKGEGYEIEKIIRKSYSWDDENRLKSIHVDSAYQKVIDSEGLMFIDLSSPYVEAYFYYSGMQTMPDSIAYGNGAKDSYFTFKKLYYLNGNISKIEDTQVDDGVLSSLSNSVFQKSTYLDYSEEDNYLYPLYNKLGFLPKGLGYVTSKKMIATSEIVEKTLLSSVGAVIDSRTITIKNTYSSNKSSNGYPTLINVNSMMDFENGDGYSSGGSVVTYIQY